MKKYLFLLIFFISSACCAEAELNIKNDVDVRRFGGNASFGILFPKSKHMSLPRSAMLHLTSRCISKGINCVNLDEVGDTVDFKNYTIRLGCALRCNGCYASPNNRMIIVFNIDTGLVSYEGECHQINSVWYPVYDPGSKTITLKYNDPVNPRVSFIRKGTETQSKLMLVGGDSHNEYLGCLSCWNADSDSVFNSAGRYGSETSPESIFNGTGQYGSTISNYSPCNSEALSPPEIFDSNGNFYGDLTIKRSDPKIIHSDALLSWLENKVCSHH